MEAIIEGHHFSLNIERMAEIGGHFRLGSESMAALPVARRRLQHCHLSVAECWPQIDSVGGPGPQETVNPLRQVKLASRAMSQSLLFSLHIYADPKYLVVIS